MTKPIDRDSKWLTNKEITVSHSELRDEIVGVINESSIEITELIEDAIDNLLNVIEEEDEDKQLDMEDVED